MSSYENRFLGRSAVVAGGASGVGRAVAKRLKREGARVAVWDIDEAALGELAGTECADVARRVDVTDLPALRTAADAAVAKLSRIDILVVAAGITGPTVPTWDYPADEWRRVVELNLVGAFNCCQATVPQMLTSDYGRIVIISSIAGKEGNPNASAYSASKAGVIALTKSLGKELAATGVRVNCVTPAAFRSPLLEQMPQSQIDYMTSKIPMGRLGEVDEVASLICWLASDECTFSTGATFDISGGRATY
ncbi:MAG: SDR family oxidoreductase [Caulobacterales bacterium]|nr:SDR family oxidoreductase [Caulobacterales bacterium]